MKQYQFKTINPSFVNPAPRPQVIIQHPPLQFQTVYRPPPPLVYEMKVDKPLSTILPKMGNGMQAFSGVQINTQNNNISEMKKRLDVLLKQTDNLAANKSINFTANQKQASAYELNRSGAERSLTAEKKQLPPYINPMRQEKISLEHKNDQIIIPNTNQYQTINRISSSGTVSIEYSYGRPEIRKPQPNINNKYKQKPAENITKNIPPAANREREDSIEKTKSYSFQSNIKQYASTDNLRFGPKNEEIKKNVIGNEKIEEENKLGGSAYRFNFGNVNSANPEKVSSSLNTANYNKVGSNYNDYTSEVALQSSKLKQASSSSTYEFQLRIKQLQIQNNKLKTDKESISESREYYRTQVTQERKNIAKIKEEYESKIQQIYKINQSDISKYEQQIKQIRNNHQKDIQEIHESYRREISELKAQIEQKQQKIVTLVKELGNSSPQAQNITQQRQQNANKQIQQLQNQLYEKDFNIQELNSQLKAQNQNIKLLNQTVYHLKNQISELKSFQNELQTQKYSNFDQILITQMKTITNLKQTIQSLNQKANQLRQKLVQAERKNDTLGNQIKIMQLKHKSEINNINMENGIALSTKDNMIGTLNKKILTMEDRYKSAANEIKSKDEFFKQHLIGRTQSLDIKEYIENTLAKYQQSFSSSREEELATELQKSLKKLELYEKYA